MVKTTTKCILLIAILQIACQSPEKKEENFRRRQSPAALSCGGLKLSATIGKMVAADPFPGSDVQAVASTLNCDPASVPDRCASCLLRYAAERAAGNQRGAEIHLQDYYMLFDSLVTREREDAERTAVTKYRRNARMNYTAGLLLCMVASGAFYMRLIRAYRRVVDQLVDQCNALQERCYRSSRSLDAGESNLLKALECKMRLFLKQVDEAYQPANKSSFVDEFQKYVQAVTTCEFPFADLQYLINRTDFGLVDYLRAQHPGLTNFEVDVLCMLRFGFSNDGIRFICSHNNVYSIYSRRTKLRSKLGLKPGQRLEKYLEQTVCALKEGAVARGFIS